MDYSFLIATIAGLIAAPVISFLKKQDWPDEIKQVVALGASAVIAFLSILLSGGFNEVTINDWESLTAQFGIVFVSSQVFYQQYFKNTEVNTKLENSGVQ